MRFIVALMMLVFAPLANAADASFPAGTPILTEVKDFCGADGFIAFLATKDNKPVAYIVQTSKAGLMQKTVELTMHEHSGIYCTDKTVELVGIEKEGDSRYSVLFYDVIDNTSLVKKILLDTDSDPTMLALYRQDYDHIVAGNYLTKRLNGTIHFNSCCDTRLELEVHNILTEKSGKLHSQHWQEVNYIETPTGRVLNHLLIAKKEAFVAHAD